VFLANARTGEERQECVKTVTAGLVTPAGLFVPLGCLIGSFFPPPEVFCQAQCKKPPPTPGGTGATPLWTFPPLKKARARATGKPARKKKSSKPPAKKPNPGNCGGVPCTGSDVCCAAATNTGYTCCSLGCAPGGGCCSSSSGCK
jgi:hypothetical protein